MTTREKGRSARVMELHSGKWEVEVLTPEREVYRNLGVFDTFGEAMVELSKEFGVSLT